MSSDQVKEILAFLSDSFESPQSSVSLSQVRHITTRQVITFRADYQGEEITIEIEDDPSRHPGTRYQCLVTREHDGRRAVGNGTSDPTGAIMIAHWWNLD